MRCGRPRTIHSLLLIVGEFYPPASSRVPILVTRVTASALWLGDQSPRHRLIASLQIPVANTVSPPPPQFAWLHLGRGGFNSQLVLLKRTAPVAGALTDRPLSIRLVSLLALYAFSIAVKPSLGGGGSIRKGVYLLNPSSPSPAITVTAAVQSNYFPYVLFLSFSLSLSRRKRERE